MIVRETMDVGGALAASMRKAVHTTFFDVARIRADPPVEPPTFDPMESATVLPVPNLTFCPGVTASEVAAASLKGAAPTLPKISTPTRMGTVSVEVHAKIVSRPPLRVTNGTD
jgi:hypothetical protein